MMRFGAKTFFIAVILAGLLVGCGSPVTHKVNAYNNPTDTVPEYIYTDTEVAALEYIPKLPKESSSEELDTSETQKKISSPADTNKRPSVTNSPQPKANVLSSPLEVTFTNPKPYSWVALKPLTFSWTIKNDNSKVFQSLGLYDLTTNKKTYDSNLNPQINFENGLYSWTIPVSYTRPWGYSLEENHKYRLNILCSTKRDGQDQLETVQKSIDFKVDSSLAHLPAPSGKLAASVHLLGGPEYLSVEVIVTAGGSPLPGAQVSFKALSENQQYNVFTCETLPNGYANDNFRIYDQNPILVEVSVNAIGQTTSAKATYIQKY